DVGGRYDVKVLRPAVRKSIRFAEASKVGRSILAFASSHPGADAYRAHAAALEGDELSLEEPTKIEDAVPVGERV
ncbi:MAG TPA: hypothetical protein VG408_03400, partial [Actinomycetota bacterium]|nr:hypothetical protein [Actinomycetota bacterium]